MAINKKGLRKITVDNADYYWRYFEGANIFQEAPFGEIHVDFGRFFSWFGFSDPDYKKDIPKFEQRTLTPKYIQLAISFAKQSGWREGKISLIYRDGVFKVVET
ncbi:MAG: hypothetical protein ABJO36_07240 [Litorimonas sp.]